MKFRTLAKAAGILTLAVASLLYSANNKEKVRASAPSGLETRVTSVENKQEQKKKIVVLDAGHGMGNTRENLYDPGAVSGEFKEAEIVLSQAGKIKQILESRGYEVYLTRNNPSENVPLSARAEIAKKLNADVLVSLHCNSADKSAYGQEIYQGTDERSKLLAQYVQSELIKEIGKTGKFKVNNRGIKNRNLRVLNTNIPTILVESGFLSNDNDRVYLTDKVDDVETAITNGIDGYLKLNNIINERLKVYDGFVDKYVEEFNKSRGINLDSDLVRAVIFKECSANKTNDPMQIANSVCPALEALVNGKENTNLIGDFSRLKGKTKNNMFVEDGIYGGIGWLIHKAAIYEERIVEGDETAVYEIKKGDSFWKIAKENGTTISTLMEYNLGLDAKKLEIGKKLMVKSAKKEMYISGWRSWEEAVKRYNGGGDSDYVEKVYSILKEIKDSKD